MRPSPDRTFRPRGIGRSRCTRPDWHQCTRRSGKYPTACKRRRRCMPYRSASPGSSMRPSQDRTFLPRDTDRWQRRLWDWSRCTCRPGNCPTACMRCRRCMRRRSASPGSSTLPSLDRTFLLRDTGRLRCTKQGSPRCTCRLGRCPTACMRCRRCMRRHSASPGSSTRPSTDCRFRPRDIDRSRCTLWDWPRCTRRSDTCQSGCTRCRRCMRYRSPSPGSSTRPSTDRTFLPRDTGRSRRRFWDWPRCTCRPGKYPTACTHRRRCTRYRSPSPGSSTRPSRGCTFPRRGTDRSRCRLWDWPRCTRRSGTCQTACTRCHRCTPSRSPSPGSSTLPSTDCRFPRRGTDRSRCT
jgi:hypothetical protein